MDLKEIKQIIELMKRTDLTEFEIEEEGFKLRIRREKDGSFSQRTQYAVAPAPAPVAPPAAAPAPAAAAAPFAKQEPVAEKDVVFIKSPMVGTFYRASSPETPAFVDKGTAVSPETVVCIIEAMKVMNEIQSEVKGTIKECLVENGQSVEYGQPLFKVQV